MREIGRQRCQSSEMLEPGPKSVGYEQHDQWHVASWGDW